MNLRNTPVDKRRLKAEDRNFDTSRRERALKSAKQRRGSLAYKENRQRRTTDRTPGSGGFGLKGRQIQQQRLRDKGQEAKTS
jgi:hypothetical protein